MSSDNGIYVLYTENEKGPEYRVAYAHAIDNIYGRFNTDLGKYEGDIKAMVSVFGDSEVFYSLNEALDYAEGIQYDNDQYLEDGICVINEFKDYGHIFG